MLHYYLYTLSMKQKDKQRISIYLSSDLIEKVKKEAAKEDRSVNYILVRTLKKAFLKSTEVPSFS